MHCRPALLALIRVCRYSENAASRHLNAQSPRAVPSLPSRESALRCAAPPCGGALFHPFPQGPLFHPAPPPTSDLPTDTAHFRSTTNRPSFAHCQRPALPTVNTPRLPNLPPPSGAPRHKRRGIRSAASTEVPKPVGTPRRIPNRQRASRRRSPEHRHAPSRKRRPASIAPAEAAPSPVASDLDALSPNERPQPSHPPPPSSDAPPYASSPGWPPWSTLVASGCSLSVSMRTNPTISSGTTYRKMGTSASE